MPAKVVMKSGLKQYEIGAISMSKFNDQAFKAQHCDPCCILFDQAWYYNEKYFAEREILPNIRTLNDLIYRIYWL